MSKKLRANILLFITALIWGSAFVGQKITTLPPITFSSARSFLAAGALLICILAINKWRKSKGISTAEKAADQKKEERKMLLIGGISCGVAMFFAGNLQQIGITYTTASKAGFITSLYIVLVPIMGLFLGRKVRPIIYASVAVATVGLYLLCIPAGATNLLSINKGDFLIMVCAIAFAIHILIIDHFAPKTEILKMVCVQFFICGILSMIPALIFETASVALIIENTLPLLYLGVMSGALAYSLQFVGQKDTDPTIASLILSLESVFAVISAVLVINEMLTFREFIGCAIMFAAIIIAQLPEKSAIPACAKQEELLATDLPNSPTCKAQEHSYRSNYETINK